MLPAGQRRQPKARLPVAIQAGCIPTNFPAILSLHPAADNRLFVEAVLFRFRAGIPWCDLPERFDDWKIVYQRFNRWAKSGVFERVFRLLASDHDNEYMMIDATIVRAH